MGFYQPHSLLQTAKNAGIPILPICVNHSQWDNTLERVSPRGKKKVHGIRLGLRLVRCMSEMGARMLVVRRKDRKDLWHEVDDFLLTSGLSRVDLTALAAADALRALGLDRRAALWIAEAAPFSSLLEEPEEEVTFERETRLEAIQADFRATTTTLGSHPTQVIREELWPYKVPAKRIVLARDANKCTPDQDVMVFGMVIVRQAPPTAHGMLFASIEDETGLHNLVIPPQIYKLYRPIIENNTFLCVSGVMQREENAFSVMARHFYAPEKPQAKVVDLDRRHARPSEIRPTPLPAAAGETLIRERNYR